MLLNALESRSEFRYWLNLGGKQTLRSYSPHSLDLDVIPADHIRFIRACRDFFETDTHIFVHANYDPERPMHRTGGTKLRWEHLDAHRHRRHCSEKIFVVGHTPQVRGEILDLGFLVGIDTNCSRGGWLSALDVGTGEVIQANQSGDLRRRKRTYCRGPLRIAWKAGNHRIVMVTAGS
jgi:serine/threonine protein phosphatase 1